VTQTVRQTHLKTTFDINCNPRKGKGRALDIAPQVDTATAEAIRYMARTVVELRGGLAPLKDRETPRNNWFERVQGGL